MKEIKGTRITLSSRSVNDRGGILLMPLKKNIKKNHSGWTLTTCPRCGRECWKSSMDDIIHAQGAVSLCTECGLRAIEAAQMQQGVM